MICIQVLLVYLLQLTCLYSVNGERAFRTSVPLTHKYKPGDTFSFSCSGNYEEGEKFHFLKIGATALEWEGKKKFGYGKYNHGTVLSTFAELDPLLEAETDRYSVEGTQNDTWFDYRLTITDVQPEDIGNFSCTVRTPEYDRSKTFVPLLVLTPISRMAILYKNYNERRPHFGEWEDNEDILIFNTTEPAGELVCVIELSNTPPIFWEVTLYDPDTKRTINVTDKFQRYYSDGLSIPHNGGLYEFLTRTHFLSKAPAEDGSEPKFNYLDSGKTLTFKAKVEGYDVKEVSTVLDIQ